MKRDKSRMPEAAPALPFNNPFAQLEARRAALPVVEPEPAPPVEPVKVSGPARAVVRLERRGRGGKEVTVIEQLGLSAVELERWLSGLKQALGCGGTVSEGSHSGSCIVLQGDQRERVSVHLEARGVKRISVG